MQPVDLTQLPGPSELLRRYGRPAKKKFGQNFLTDPSILDRIVRLAGVEVGTPVLEIGPGPGGLTTRLIAAGGDVVCIEADPDAVAFLEQQLARPYGIRVVHGDATGPVLGEELGDPPRTVVANLPYHVATPILFALVHGAHPPERMALMFQREVAVRIVLGDNDAVTGMPAVGVGIRYTTALGMSLPPGAFIPPPKVYSAVVVFRRRSEPLATGDVEAATLHTAAMAFSQRRKMLRRSLAGAPMGAEALLASAGIAPDVRPETLRLRDFVSLGQAWVDLGAPVPKGRLQIRDEA
jgi:16S rRNA (adenine1518-N6/adenine1519-N6)-dimethyltransferase